MKTKRVNRQQVVFLLLFPLSFSITIQLFAQNVGVGTTSPVARLHVADSSVLFGASGDVNFISPGNPPMSGPGRRMMWYPEKGAFRAGYVDGNQWDKTNIGYYSFASGLGNVANGGISTAMGGGTIASGAYSTTGGYVTLASGFGSTAFGFRTTAKAYGSISLGSYNDDTDTPDPSNPDNLDRIFQIGNGDINTLVKSNALTVLRNGRVGIGTMSPGTLLHVKGSAGNVATFDGASGMWVTLAEDGVNRGYIGSYSGNPEDVELGSYGGTTGSVHLTTQNTPRLTVINNGNVGVGTTTPATLLHIKQSSAGGNVPVGLLSVESNNNTYISLLSPDANESAIFFGKNSNNISGAIGYNTSSTPNGFQFNTNGAASRMVISGAGNVGIGLGNPGFPLNFAAALGDKISLWGNSGNHYGFGINSGLLQVYTDGSGSDIGFGYGSSSSFTEKFRMKGNGGLVVNGNAGNAGQLLRSGGSGQPVSWSNPLNALYNNATEYSQTGGALTVNPVTTVYLPGMSGLSLVISSRSKVIVDASADVTSNTCFGCGGSHAILVVQVFLTGGGPLNTASVQTNIDPGEQHTFVTGTKIITLNPGTYTIDTPIRNDNLSGPTLTVTSGKLSVIVIQE